MGLKITGLEKRYKDFSLTADLSINKGEMFSLLGPSGCGKTTLLRLIGGLIAPDAGRIILDGNDITKTPPEKRNIGIVFQDYALFPHMGVSANIAYGLKTRKWDRKDITRRVDYLLEVLRLSGYQSRKIPELSGGEQQRVALARALAPNPALLLLDEPLSALDAELRKSLRKEIRNIQNELKLTAVYVTHDQEEALAISDRIALISEGRIDQTGSPESLYSNPETIFSAGFIGISNRLPARILDYSDDNVRIKVLSAEFTIKSVKVDPDSEYSLFFRPEHCREAAENGAENTIEGIVKGSEYHGIHYQNDISAGGETIKLYSPKRLKLDDKVRFTVLPDHVRLIKH